MKRADILKYDKHSFTELKEAVFRAYYEYDANTLDRCFGCLIGNYIEILKHDGDNKYPTPHFGNRKRQREGEFTCTLQRHL
jgi:hypothetical protein